jgi:hypothetical protein
MNSATDISRSPVHINFSLERDDLFQASLQIVKRRLLIGIGILVLFTAGVIYLFVLIDELGLLLQLSPLFIGFPIMGIAGQVLRVHATCRKYFSSLSESQRRINYMFTDNADGYDLQHGDSFSHIAWTDVSRVVEQSAFFLIYFNRYQAYIIPKRGFHQQADIPRFKSIVRSKLGTKRCCFELN